MNYNFSKQRFDAVEKNEEKIQDYCVAKGWHVLPTTRMCEGKETAPVFASQDCEVLPDFLIFQGTKTFWIEVKTATQAPKNKRHNCNVLGIKKNNYRDYCKVAESTGFDVLIVFVLADKYVLTGTVKNLPKPWPCQCRNCSSGNESDCLARDNENMVYWNILDLRRNMVLEQYYFGTNGEKENV